MDLQRYGRSPKGFPYLLTALPDGYWTPWHVADQQIRRLESRLEELEAGQAVGEAEDLRREVEGLRDLLRRMLETPTTQISATWKDAVRQTLGNQTDTEDSNEMRQLVSDMVKRDAYRFRKLMMQDKHWLGVFRCDPDGAPSDSLSHVELKALLDAMNGPEMDF